MSSVDKRPVALITGVSRDIGIGAAIARSLSLAGWDLALTYWRPYDESMPWGSDSKDGEILETELRRYGSSVLFIESDLSKSESPQAVFDTVRENMGPVRALILNHCYSVDSDIFSTTIESFDRHFAINTRAAWLMIRHFAESFSEESGSGRILAITSDHTAGNLPYGASKGAMDRIVLAAAQELKDKGITANVINPGATDTGWMTPELKESVRQMTFSGRIGMPEDCANLVRFLCGPEGQWINGQLLYSNGGIA